MLDINIPEVVAELRAAFARYEAALVSNDVETLENAFWESPHALRYGATENLYGHREIVAFRRSRDPAALERDLMRTQIMTYGRDFATVNTMFRRKGIDKLGRQSQTWVRFPEGWKIVSAHVSLMQH
jgi:hypothetical protein